jgi:hypothetical protein
MGFVVVVIILAIIVGLFLIRFAAKHDATAEGLPYTKLDALFSPAERSFLGVLNQVVDDNIYIFGKVRVADVVTPKKGMSRSNWQKAFNRISGKHFDYLLCNKNDLSVLCAIELNDRSHKSETRKDRDVFLKGVCEVANLPLIYISAKATYNIHDVKQAMAPFLPFGLPRETDIVPNPSSVERDAKIIEKLCPRCSSPMVKKTAKKGKHNGNDFWACSAFPKCRHIEAIDV